MRRPLRGWPRYKTQGQRAAKGVATVFIVFGLISLMTAWYYAGAVSKQTFTVNPDQIEWEARSNPSAGPRAVAGPIRVTRAREVYEISVTANLPVQSWSFIEIQVYDQNRNYLFSFGKELWHETGRDSDGPWRENKNHYSTKATFPETGSYFLGIRTESNNIPNRAVVTVSKKRGSALPHLWFGIFAIIGGIIVNEMGNGFIRKNLMECESENIVGKIASYIFFLFFAFFFIIILIFGD